MKNSLHDLLLEVEELEGEAQRIWDHSSSNLAYGYLSDEKRNEYIQLTYRATELHTQAMEKLRQSQEQARAGFTVYSAN